VIGEIVNIVEDRGYFFVRGDNGVEYFAHKSALYLIRWEDVVQGMRVEFEPDGDHPKGPRTEHVEACV
jgi:cold shock CspA family protein